MSEERCPYCLTPFGGDLDENGKKFCDCEAARANRNADYEDITPYNAEIARLRAVIDRAYQLAGESTDAPQFQLGRIFEVLRNATIRGDTK